MGDPQSFLAGLVDGATLALSAPVAASVLVVERRRSLSDRLAGRPGPITSIRLESAGETMTLTLLPGPRYTAESHRVSGSVVISRRTLSVGEWMQAFAGRIAAIAGDVAGDVSASAHALQSLGILSPDSDAGVAEATLALDLRSLPGRIGGRVPADAVAAVQRICDVLLDTLPRVTGSGEAGVIALRAATAYLPDTLRAYLALPRDWARAHVFADGSTPDTALVAQLAVLEAAVARMHDAAINNDASALLVNGRFLTDRFAASRLELP